MDFGFLRDRSFRLYKTNQFPVFSVSHQDLISSLVAKYVYTKYIKASDDLIPRYRSAKDVKVNVRSERFELDGLSLLHLSIEQGSTIQTLAFIQQNQKCSALMRSASPLFLAEILESLDLEVPLALEPYTMTNNFITRYVNGLSQLVSEDSSVLGQVDLAFNPAKALTGNSLRTITVSFTKEDCKHILPTNDQPLESLYSWLAKTTSLKFENLCLVSFSSSLVSLKTNTLTITSGLAEEKGVVILLSKIVENVNEGN